MCGIAGCVGHHDAVGFVSRGLQSMEYRGYDSAGIAYPGVELPSIEVIRAVGKVSNLLTEIPPEVHEHTIAIGHTRWATHGKPGVIENVHPHTNADSTIAVVHNGTIENYDGLKEDLIADGYSFRSESDTEVVPLLLDRFIREGLEPDEAFDKTIRVLKGANAIVAYFGVEADTLYAANLGGQLLVGVFGDDQRLVASDHKALRGIRHQGELEDFEMARLTPGKEGYKVWKFDTPKATPKMREVSEEAELADKGEHERWMLKEILETPETVRRAVTGRVMVEEGIVRLGGLESPEVQRLLQRTERFIIVGCGTSYHAGLMGERLIEELAGIPVEVQEAGEFQYQVQPLDYKTAVWGISQSGATTDTLGALKYVQQKGLVTLGLNNTPGSAMDRLTDAGVHCRAGEEISVASTKAFVSQVTNLAEIALFLSREKGPLHHAIMAELHELPEKIERVLANTSAIEEAARKYGKFDNFQYIGRGYEHISAKEGALKLKEITYVHAEAYSASGMKHGPLALIDENFPTFAIATNGSLFEKTLSNIEEVVARDGPVLVLATEGNKRIEKMHASGKIQDVLYVPASLEQTQPIINAVVMQLFAYYVAIARGLGDKIDQPRNLAKTVTVE